MPTAVSVSPRDTTGRRRQVYLAVTALLVVAVFFVFGRLSLRHIGGSYFLGDQVGLLQDFERFLQLKPDGLLGPWMSGTDPLARALGPSSSFLLGMPVKLGFGPDGGQVVTSVLLVLATLAAFLSLSSIHAPFAWAWLTIFTAIRMVWWNAAMLWGAAMLLPIGCLLLAVIALALRRPSIGWLSALVLVILFALQTHLVALAAVPVAVAVVAVVWRPALNRVPNLPAIVGLTAAAALAIGPSLLSEAMTGFSNSATIIRNISGGHAQTTGREGFQQVLRYAADPTQDLQRLGLPEPARLTIAVAIVVAALLLWAAARRNREDARTAARNAMFWLVVCSAIGIIGQAAFFFVMNRPLLGFHYITLLVPLYAIPAAAVIAVVVEWLPAAITPMVSAALGVTCLALLVMRGPSLADRNWERTEWSYPHIAAGIDAVCDRSSAVRTVEGPELTSPIAGHDPVVRYLLTRHLVECRYDAASDALIVALVDGPFPPTRAHAGGTYSLVKKVPPGIALYRKAKS